MAPTALSTLAKFVCVCVCMCDAEGLAMERVLRIFRTPAQIEKRIRQLEFDSMRLRVETETFLQEVANCESSGMAVDAKKRETFRRLAETLHQFADDTATVEHQSGTRQTEALR